MEYKVLQLSLIAMERAINTLAAEGWRVINVSPIGAYVTVVLERPRAVGPGGPVGPRETK
jgi:hypothetical protein